MKAPDKPLVPPLSKRIVKTITLEVDVPKLWDLKYPPDFDEIYEHCRMYDSDSKKVFEGKEIRDFVTEVEPGEIIEWVGKTRSNESEFAVKIDSIVYAYGKRSDVEKFKRRNFFDRMALCSNNGRTVIRKVEDHIPTGLDLTNIYWINFWVYDGKEYKGYSIDPRLKIQ